MIQFVLSNKSKKSFISRLICLIEDTEGSHYSIHYVDKVTGQRMVYESSYGEAHSMLYDKWIERNEVIEVVNIKNTPQQYVKMCELFNQFRQNGYSYLGLLGVLWFYLTGGKKNVFSDGAKTMFCSELCAMVLIKVFGYNFKIDPELVGIKYLQNYLHRMVETQGKE